MEEELESYGSPLLDRLQHGQVEPQRCTQCRFTLAWDLPRWPYILRLPAAPIIARFCCLECLRMFVWMRADFGDTQA